MTEQQLLQQHQPKTSTALNFKWVTALQKFNEDKEHKSPAENDKEADR